MSSWLDFLPYFVLVAWVLYAVFVVPWEKRRVRAKYEREHGPWPPEWDDDGDDD